MNGFANDFLLSNQPALNLGIALLLGAVIGIQRGWQARNRKAGERIAGVRTFALVGLFGGISALLADEITIWVLPAAMLSLTAITLVAFSHQARQQNTYSITNLVCLLLTFSYGAVTIAISPALAAAAAVITAIILDNREEIHGLLNRLQEKELDAGLKLLLITVVMLPLLPNRGFGPGEALNPYNIWIMVVLIAMISFIGYFAVRVVGTAKGILFTSLFAGLSSSTALTLHYAKASRSADELSPQLAAGILIACGTMFPRILVYCTLLNQALLPVLLGPVLITVLFIYAPALLLWYQHRDALATEQPTLNKNPLDLSSALMFGALLAGILLLAELLTQWLGDKGVLILSVVSGLVDVDAITLAIARLSLGSLDQDTAVIAILLAALSNSLIKAAMALVFGTRGLGLRVAIPMTIAVGAGVMAAWLQAVVS